VWCCHLYNFGGQEMIPRGDYGSLTSLGPELRAGAVAVDLGVNRRYLLVDINDIRW
jgi:hypothetical protein